MNKSYWRNKKILITGGYGFIGRHVVDKLFKECDVEPSQIIIPEEKKDDLRLWQNAVRMMKGVDIVLHLAADVGGVGYSSQFPATQMRNCLLIDLNVFEAAAQEKINKLVAVSSAVVYSPEAKSPLKEKDLFFDVPADTGYGYGFAKRMTCVLAKAYRQERNLNAVVLLPTNSYGPGQDFDLKRSHVISALIYKCLTQDKLVVWGDGTPKRDFIYVDDFASGVILAAEKLGRAIPLNLGSGQETSIKDLVGLIVKLTNFQGEVIYDNSKPKGQPRRSVDINQARKLLCFRPQWKLNKGLKETVKWIKEQINV